MRHLAKNTAWLSLMGVLLTISAQAGLPIEVAAGPEVTTLGPPSPHWVWVNDMVFPHMSDGSAMLIDGDSGQYLGTLSTGFGFMHVVLPHDGKMIYSPETYFSRGTRGVRTDVVTIYDARTLTAVSEIPIPPKRSANLPMLANNVLTDDDRFLLIYNFTPAQSVTVVDMKIQKFAGEVETPGCALVYPTGPRSFFSVCGDGSLALGLIDEAGAVKITRTDRLFALGDDPVTEKAARRGNVWYFVTFDGQIVPLTASGTRASKGIAWWVTSAEERAEHWRPGGQQQLAIDAGSRLYVLLHQGGLYTHKDPGKDVWVYDLSSHKRLAQLKLQNLASAIEVTQDPKPLLFSTFADKPVLDVYDARGGQILRTIDQVGTTPMLLVTP